MNIIITAGGTIEKIDDVRAISNNSTGKLGAAIAEAFISSDLASINKIFYICGQNAVVPALEMLSKITIVRITSVSDLAIQLENILNKENIDVVVHSMAVSDYTVSSLTTKNKILSSVTSFLEQEMQNNLMDKNTCSDLALKIVENCLCGTISLQSNNKISSDIDDLVIMMHKTPKIISMIKELQPKTILVGFKLLSNVSLNTLIDTGYSLLKKNNCDLVLANDLSQISNDMHVGYLISSSKAYEKLETKAQIAKAIVAKVFQLYSTRQVK